jgi:hypothetical protein
MTYPQNADLETPVEDAAEQAASALPDRYEDGAPGDRPLGAETPEWDAREQEQSVGWEDDDYR